MKFDTKTTIGAFVVLLIILIGGTAMSPMSTSTIAVVSGGLIIFGLISLAIGVKHGEYRMNPK